MLTRRIEDDDLLPNARPAFIFAARGAWRDYLRIIPGYSPGKAESRKQKMEIRFLMKQDRLQDTPPTHC